MRHITRSGVERLQGKPVSQHPLWNRCKSRVLVRVLVRGYSYELGMLKRSARAMLCSCRVIDCRMRMYECMCGWCGVADQAAGTLTPALVTQSACCRRPTWQQGTSLRAGSSTKLATRLSTTPSSCGRSARVPMAWAASRRRSSFSTSCSPSLVAQLSSPLLVSTPAAPSSRRS